MSDSNCPSVAVLMSTYNGEKYLREQVDSILNQKDVDVHLYIRDDGSTDTTLDIVREYIAANPERVSLTVGENLGVGRSFMDLVYNVPDTYDYYAFSDQDDVWLDDKLIAGTLFLKAHHKDLYASNQMCVDEKLNPLGLKHQKPPDTHPYGIIQGNSMSGCTMIFSSHLFQILRDEAHSPDENIIRLRYHDVWTAMTASVLGTLAYDFDYHILYRQHGSNVVGSVVYDSVCKKAKRGFKQKLKKFLDKSKRNLRSKTAHSIVMAFPEETKSFPYLQNLKQYAEAHTVKNKIKLIQSYKDYGKHGGNQSFLGFFLYVCFNLI